MAGCAWANVAQKKRLTPTIAVLFRVFIQISHQKAAQGPALERQKSHDDSSGFLNHAS
jgi:hypothetical protein